MLHSHENTIGNAITRLASLVLKIDNGRVTPNHIVEVLRGELELILDCLVYEKEEYPENYQFRIALIKGKTK